MVINPALLGGQEKDYLEDSFNLASCAHQTDLRTDLTKTGYTKKRLEARRSHGPKPGTKVPRIAADPRHSLRICGKVVEPRVDFRRVAPSRLLDSSESYK